MKNISFPKISFFILVLVSSSVLYGCGEQVCSYCGEEKQCHEYDILGTTRFICEDCLNNPAASIISGNVIQEYSDLPVSGNLVLVTDYFQSTDVTTSEETNHSDENLSESNEITGNNNTSGDHAAGSDDVSGDNFFDSDNGSGDTISSGSDDNTNTNPGESESAPENSNAQESSQPVASYNSVMGKLNETYVSAGLQLVPEDNNNTTFGLYNGGTFLGIKFAFSNTGSTPPTLSVQNYGNANASDYSAACINAILAFYGSDDYDGVGYDTYTRTQEHGNYSANGLHFYYTNYGSAQDGNPAVTFDIS
ncbi:MAG: hypothetical protein ACI4DU_00760 [Lachnospiraceae bacterium]